MNEVPYGEVLTELGEAAADELGKLMGSLGLNPDDLARMAPSIIVRSEAELFGCAMPRFAYRVYFKKKRGFVNVRRLPELAENIRLRIWPDVNEDGRPVEMSPTELQALVKKQSCIADCLFERPDFLLDSRFHLNMVALSAAYGETCCAADGVSDYSGTPFVKSLTLGGGVCMQSAAFMATAMLHSFGTGVHGMAEITALAYPERRNSIPISGMNWQRSQRYFSRVKLSMSIQCPSPDALHFQPKREERIKEFALGLAAYSQSGFPAIIPVDCGRMNGAFKRPGAVDFDPQRGIYWQNGLQLIDSQFNATLPRRHCVVLVGCERIDFGRNQYFIFNDPSHFPFMFARAHQLADVGCYIPGKEDEIESCTFWPITPSAVRMPLLWHIPLNCDPPSDYLPGLKYIADNYRVFNGFAFPKEVHYLLVQSGALSDRDFLQKRILSVIGSEALELKLLAGLPTFGKEFAERHLGSAQHWVWLELAADRIWIWDAEMEPSAVLSSLGDCLIARIHIDDRGPNIIWNDD